MRSRTADDLDFLRRAYDNPYDPPDTPPDPLFAHLVQAGILTQPESAHALLREAVDVHPDPLRAVAAQALETGSRDDEGLASQIYQGLATAGYPEAAAVLLVGRAGDRLRSEERERWQAWLHRNWPALVPVHRSGVTTVIGSAATASITSSRQPSELSHVAGSEILRNRRGRRRLSPP